MIESKKPVKTFLIRAICSTCGGELKFACWSTMMQPPKYGHNCVGCGLEERLDYVYPRTVHEEEK